MEVQYKNIDPKLIVNEVRNGRSLETVQKIFGLRFKSEVQDLYMKGLAELGEIPSVDFAANGNSAVKAPVQMPSNTPQQSSESIPAAIIIKSPAGRTIGQSGSITLNKTLLINDLGFTIGDTFEIYREENKIILKRVSTGV